MLTQFRKIGKKRLLAQTLQFSGAFSMLRPFTSKNLTIFNYHRIKANVAAPHPFDDSIYGPTQDQLQRELAWMKQFGEPVSEANLIAHVNESVPLPRHGFMVTFDDGYRDNFDLALPVLEAEGIPAIFFIPTQAIEDRQLGWWEHIYWYLKNTKKTEITFRGQRFQVPRPVMPLAEQFTRMMKLEAAATTSSFLNELSAACEVAPPSAALCDAQLMSWDQIRQARQRGISIGAHTHSHRVLATLTLDEQHSELQRSKRILEEKTGAPIRSLAYPVGGYEHFNVETMDIARRCGYDLAFSFLTGVNKPGKINPYDVKRVDRQLDRVTYHGAFAMPWLFARRTSAWTRPGSCRHENNLQLKVSNETCR